MPHLYVHIPYCRAKCPYCDFNCDTPDKLPPPAKYVDALLRDLNAIEGSFETIYLGGGTPNELPIDDLDRLLAALSTRSNGEWSIEANPLTFTRDVADRCLSRGVTRVSLGIQSAHDDILKRLGRVHRHADTVAAVELVREFPERSGDIIFGLADDRVEETIDFMAESGMTHVSAYELTIEGNSAWKRMKIDPSDNDDRKTEKLMTIRDRLAARGYRRYEVSNYAFPGHECRSHLNVWGSGEFAAIGAGAHGFENGVRYRNTPSSWEYIESAGRTAEPSGDQPAEMMFLGMRMADGIPLSAFPAERRADLSKLEDDGYVTLTSDRIRPTERGLLFVNDIALRLS